MSKTNLKVIQTEPIDEGLVIEGAKKVVLDMVIEELQASIKEALLDKTLIQLSPELIYIAKLLNTVKIANEINEHKGS
jgi:hypothetical protein